MNGIIEEIRECSTITAHETQRGFEKAYLFKSDFSGFQGHFPGNPILPAIVQLITARESIIEQMNKTLVITKISRAKFQKIIVPDIPFTVIWNISNEENSFVCKCKLETDGEPASSFTITLSEKAN